MRSLLTDMEEERSSVPRTSDPRRALRDDVLDHLRSLCSTLRGSMLVAPDYGVDDATNVFHDYPQSAEAQRAALETAVHRYEPRLVHATVRHIPSETFELVLRFEIRGVLVHEGILVPTRFSTTIHADRIAVT